MTLWNSGIREVIGISLIGSDDVFNSLQLILRDVAVEFMFIFDRFLALHFVDLTPSWADGFAAKVLQRIQQFIVVLNV
jgi:hypothetical protein